MNEFQMPLAARMRPATLDEYVGQEHLLAPGTALRQVLENGKPHSMIFWGPPGSGKTTLARLLAQRTGASFQTLSAVNAGVKELRSVIEVARQSRAEGRTTVLFIDEVHRFNKSQQDALLPCVEEGLFTLIGATTENPSFEINRALLSRVRVYPLQKIEPDAIVSVLQRALYDEERGVGFSLELDAEQLALIAEAAQGDVRSALGMLEVIAEYAQLEGLGKVESALFDKLLSEHLPQFDKRGDSFYELISALHKAVRGSAPDAALYWLARMLKGGCDPLYVARRLVRMASEDIGVADPRALRVALDAWDVQSRLGSPEGELALAQALVYLASAPKSNAVYRAYKSACDSVQNYPAEAVPLHLRNAPTGLMKSMGYGDEYRYAHDYPDGFAAGESYLPESLAELTLYEPSNRGLEIRIGDKLKRLHRANAESQFQRYRSVVK